MRLPHRGDRAASRRVARLWLLAGILYAAACAPGGHNGAGVDEVAGTATPSARAAAAPIDRPSLERSEVPMAMRPCFDCHRDAIESYLEHGMSASLGAGREISPGVVDNPISGMRYEISARDGAMWLEATLAGGGTRRQRIVGRIGAGNFDVSWAAEEVDPWTGEPTGRLFFAPVETITGRGLELSPFDQIAGSPGLDMPLAGSCITCHTLSAVEELPQAAGAGTLATVFPANALGSEAFAHLQPLACDACHGSTARHVEIMEGRLLADADDLGLPRLATLPAAEQRDRCARCHLQGDARFEVAAPIDSAVPLTGQLPVLVSAKPPGDDFRFVGQLERLALSRCFIKSAEMTCTTCHGAHVGAAEQGVASFDAACLSCHGELVALGPESHSERRAAETPIESITGDPARTEHGCVDCHVRRSQPFDLPHVRSADHYIRRQIPLPRDDIEHRQFTVPGGDLRLFDDGRLAAALDTPGGERWLAGVEAMALLTVGQVERSAERFAEFALPGTPAALEPSAPPGLAALETYATFHHLRGLALMATGSFQDALAAQSDALEIDPTSPAPRLARAQLRHDLGDRSGGMLDTEEIVQLYPTAEAPWLMRASMMARANRPDLAVLALERATQLWPSNPETWRQLANAATAAGRTDLSTEAVRRAESLAASRTPVR